MLYMYVFSIMILHSYIHACTYSYTSPVCSQGHENCFYHGEVVEEPEWTVVLSTCLGLRYMCITNCILPTQKKLIGELGQFCHVKSLGKKFCHT